MLRLRLLLPLCLFSVVLMGCGGTDGPALDLAPAEGTLTIGGAPLPNALVTFHPESGRPATGRTDDAGHFTLMTKGPGDGAAVGNHKVTVMADSSVSAEINSEDAYTTPDPNSAVQSLQKSTQKMLIQRQIRIPIPGFPGNM